MALKTEEGLITKGKEWVAEQTLGRADLWLEGKLGEVKAWFSLKMSVLWAGFVEYGIQLIQIGVVCYLCYLAIRHMIVKEKEDIGGKIYMVVMIYAVVKIFWSVILEGSV